MIVAPCTVSFGNLIWRHYPWLIFLKYKETVIGMAEQAKCCGGQDQGLCHTKEIWCLEELSLWHLEILGLAGVISMVKWWKLMFTSKATFLFTFLGLFKRSEKGIFPSFCFSTLIFHKLIWVHIDKLKQSYEQILVFYHMTRK